MGDGPTVGELEDLLFTAFPLKDAEHWDRCGLAVGERDTHAERIAFALDMSAETVIAAHAHGCKTLVTHHPPFIKEGPREFGPQRQERSEGPGRMVFEAVRRGVNTIAMHTNADRAVATRERFADLLGMRCLGNVEHVLDPGRAPVGTGYGALLEPDTVLTLGELAARCATVLGGAPRVWGSASRLVSRIALLNGSWGEPGLFATCMRAQIDCVVVGETKYHQCVDAQPHLGIVDLGHDVSEQPLVDVLCQAVRAAGVPAEMLVKLDLPAAAWWVPGREA